MNTYDGMTVVMLTNVITSKVILDIVQFIGDTYSFKDYPDIIVMYDRIYFKDPEAAMIFRLKFPV